MDSSPSRPTGSYIAPEHLDAYTTLVEQAMALPSVGPLKPWATPHGQVMLSTPSELDPFVTPARTACPDSQSLLNLLRELDGWVIWDRKIGYAIGVAASWIATGTPLEATARALLAVAQVNYDHGAAIANLDAAYLYSFDEHVASSERATVRGHANLLYAARRSYLDTYAKPVAYGDIDAFIAHPYFLLSVLRYSTHCTGYPARDADIAGTIALDVANGDQYWAVVGGRLYGDRLAGQGDADGALAAHEDALRRALELALTTEIGHLERSIGSKLIERALRERHGGELEAARRSLEQAIERLEQAATFEADDGCEYFEALAQYRLGDAQRYLAEIASPGSQPIVATYNSALALASYDAARKLIDRHCLTEPPADVAVKRQILASYVATALDHANRCGAAAMVLGHIASDGPTTITTLGRELDDLRRLPEGLRRALAKTRAAYRRELDAARAGPDTYRTYLQDQIENRVGYQIGQHWRAGLVSPPNDVHDLAHTLPADTVIVAIDPCQNSSHIVMIGPGIHPRAARTGRFTAGDVTDIHGRLARAITHPAGPTVLRRALDDTIEWANKALVPALQVVLDGIEARRLILLPYRQLANLPLHAVTIDGVRLGDRYDVMYAPGFDAFHGRNARPPAHGGVTMVHDSIGAPFFAALTTSPASFGIDAVLPNPQWDEISALAPMQATPAVDGIDPLTGEFIVSFETLGLDSTELSGAPEPPTQAAAGSSRHLFFACHARFEPLDPFESVLLLDDQTRTIDLTDVLTGVDLGAWTSVILAACETGRARHDLTTESASIAGLFLAAGVDAVVASLWPVDALATAILMAAYLPAITSGTSAPTALTQAAQVIRDMTAAQLREWATRHLPSNLADVAGRRADQSEHPFAHPYYWAGFIVTGRP